MLVCPLVEGVLRSQHGVPLLPGMWQGYVSCLPWRGWGSQGKEVCCFWVQAQAL